MQTTQPPKPVVKTWKPTTAGILDIVAGASSLVGAIVLFFLTHVVGTANIFLEEDVQSLGIDFINGIFVFFAVFLVVVGILALVGGIFALQRRQWGLALAGSIAATLGSNVIGILAIVFLAMGKDEFV